MHIGLHGRRALCRSNQSIRAFCRAGTDRCGTSGYGPVEFIDDAANMICVQATVLDVTFADLTVQHPGCTSASAYSIYCGAAINRLCNVQGMTTGFGPVRVAGESLHLRILITDDEELWNDFVQRQNTIGRSLSETNRALLLRPRVLLRRSR